MKLTPSTKNNIILDYAKGISITKLAETYGISRQTVYKVVDPEYKEQADNYQRNIPTPQKTGYQTRWRTKNKMIAKGKNVKNSIAIDIEILNKRRK